jgi:hypothetical protein
MHAKEPQMDLQDIFYPGLPWAFVSHAPSLWGYSVLFRQGEHAEVSVPLHACVQDACVSLFYGNEKQAQHSVVVHLEFSEFLNPQLFKSTIRTDQASAFYNRQSMVQIFSRIPASQHIALTVKIDDPEGEFTNRKISLKHVLKQRTTKSTPAPYNSRFI